MPGSVTRAGSIPAAVEKGRIIDVNIATYTVSVVTEFTKKPQNGISFATPYQHYEDGEGIYFMPEVGSLCWVCFPSDGNRPFILAWASAQTEGDYRAKKRDLNPGDTFLGTRDGNFIYLRRGGVVQIGAGALAQRMYLPINNTIRDFCENYNLSTLAGDFEWSVARDEKTTDGHRPAHVRLRARQFADDAKPIAELEIGSHDGDAKTILSLKIRADGTAGAAQKFSLLIDNVGNVTWKVEKDVVWNVTGKVTVNAQDDVTISTTQNLKASGNAATLEATGQSATIKGATTVEVSGGMGINLNSLTKVGGGSTPVMIATPNLILWLLGHAHLCSAPASPSGPPIPGIPVALTPADFVATSLFSK